MGFGPRIDVERQVPFLAQHPTDLIKGGLFNDVPFMIGANRNESSFLFIGLIQHS